MGQLKLYPCLEEVLAFHSYFEKVDALYKFDRGINKDNMFGDNVEYYKQIGLQNGHTGQDISCQRGVNVVASIKSWVREEHDDIQDINAGYGVVLVSTEPYVWLDGEEAYVKTIYWHNYKNLVELGDIVEVGQPLGLSDSTGFSTGDHVHFGLKKCDKDGNTLNHGNGYFGAVNPYPYWAYWDLTNMHVCSESCKLNTDLKMDLAYQGLLKRKPDEEGKKFWWDKCVFTFMDEAMKQSEYVGITRIVQIGKYVLQLAKKL